MTGDVRVTETGEQDGYQWAVTAHPIGHRCGYVRLPDDHIVHGVEYQALSEWGLDVHGGLTFSRANPIMRDSPLLDGWWLGFDCSHSHDWPDPALMSPGFRRFHDKHGFARIPGSTVKSHAYVREQCLGLIDQLRQAQRTVYPDSSAGMTARDVKDAR